MATPSEYQDEYCGRGATAGKGGSKHSKPAPIVPCSKSLEDQPVGGRGAARYRAVQGIPGVDGDFVATVYSQEDRGTQKAQPIWRDARWSEPPRAANSTLYAPADRDPANRNNFHMYRSTLVDPMKTPCTPLSVPDVHKLRYMHNNYMTPDDWY